MQKILDKKDFPQWLNEILAAQGVNVRTVTAKVGETFTGIGRPVYDYEMVRVIAYNNITKQCVVQRGCTYEGYINATKEQRAIYNGVTFQAQPNIFMIEINDISAHTSVTVYAHPADITKSIEEKASLSKDELIVLVATRSLKSSYAGISNYRFHSASGQLGITLDRWNAAKESCISKGLLNKAGAITTAGKNAVPYGTYNGLYALKNI